MITDWGKYEERLQSMTREQLIDECRELKNEIEMFNDAMKKGHIGDPEKAWNAGYDEGFEKGRYR